ncbi:MAG: recombinase family protein [Butyricicoccus sp.]
MLSIAGYARISVDEEPSADNPSIENQKSIISEYTAAHFPDASLTFFEDRDRSGYTFEQREGYQAMRAALRAGRFSIVIVKDFSRFSRRNSLGLYELEVLRDEGVRIISIGDGVDYPTRDDWLAIQFRFLMNEMPVTDTSKKVRAVIRSRQSRGEWICAVPYGYYLHPLHKNQICIDEEGARAVRRIYELYNAGWGYRRIAAYLTEHGYPTGLQLAAKQLRARGADASKLERRASPIWNANSVAKILGNDFYIGTLRQGMWQRPGINKADRRTDPSAHQVFPNHHPAILDRETFEHAQEQARRRTHTPYRGERKYPHPYSGLLFCADCGSPMFGISYPNRPAGYLCGAYHRRGRAACTSHHIHERTLDDSMRAYLSTVRDRMADALTQLDETRRETLAATLADRLSALAAEEEQLRRELEASTRERLRQLVASPDREAAIHQTFDRLERRYHDELDALSRKKALLERESSQRAALTENLESALARFDRLLAAGHFTRQDLQLLSERIEVDAAGTVTIQLKSDITELLESEE